MADTLPRKRPPPRPPHPWRATGWHLKSGKVISYSMQMPGMVEAHVERSDPKDPWHWRLGGAGSTFNAETGRYSQSKSQPYATADGAAQDAEREMERRLHQALHAIGTIRKERFFNPMEAAEIWVIVRQPGCVPERKRPPEQTPAGTLAFLREGFACRPEGTQFTVVELTHDYDLHVWDGREGVTIDEHMASIDWNEVEAARGMEHDT